MTRQETIHEIHRHLESMDSDKLERVLKLLKHQGENLSAAGVPYTGDPETDAVLDDCPDIFERLGRLERNESKTVSWDEVKANQRAKRGLKRV